MVVVLVRSVSEGKGQTKGVIVQRRNKLYV